MSKSPDLSVEIAHSVFQTRFENLPQSAIDGAKKSILDTLGVCLAASGREPAVRSLVDFVIETGGRPESSVLGFGKRVPAIMAAFANGAMAHCLDYDDQTPWGQHSASSLLPAVFAVSERNGRVSGKRMISAIAAGQDLFNRLRGNIDWRKDWNFSTVMGVFCAAAASSYTLGLSRDQIVHALGIASMQSCGTAEVIDSTGSDLRAMYAGFPAKGAALAALLAERGISGVPKVLEGRYGILNLYFNGRYDRKKITDGLGHDYTGGLTLYKRWPAVGTAHSHIYATIQLMNQHDLNASDVAEIRVHVGDYHQRMCEPIGARRKPETLVDAKFSLPFLVAIAAVRRDIQLSDFTDEAMHNAEVLDAAQKVVPISDSSLDWKMELPPGRVEIVMRDGRRFERTGTAIPGSAENPMSWDDLSEKFVDCCKAARYPLSSERVTRALKMAKDLETLDDANELLRLCASGQST